MTELPRRALGRTGLEVTSICFGGAPLASMPENFGYEVDEPQAIATMRAVLDSPINFVDTSNGYGAGRSEERIGAALREAGGLPSGMVLATKVDPDPATGAFDARRVRSSAEESLARLGLSSFQLLFLHDPEIVTFEEATGPGGALEGLVRLRDEGLAPHLGVAGGPVGLLEQYLDTGEMEVLLTHNRFTLLDRSAEALIEKAASRGVGVINAAPFGGGLLSGATAVGSRYAYTPASAEKMARLAEIKQACDRAGVPLRAAALQWSVRDKRIVSTVVGTANPAHVADLVNLACTELPDELAATLQGLDSPPSDWLW